MEQLDRETVRKIWQRVQAQAPRQPVGQSCLWREKEWILAGWYARLAGRLPGQKKRLLRLAQQSRSHAATLSGICRLQGIKMPPFREDRQAYSTRQLLQLCYRESLQLTRLYRSLAAEPQHGEIFEKLADEASSQRHNILEIMGKLPASGR